MGISSNMGECVNSTVFVMNTGCDRHLIALVWVKIDQWTCNVQNKALGISQIYAKGNEKVDK